MFRWRRKDYNDVMETRLSGNAFQILAAATGKAWLPIVESLKGDTTRRLVPEERRQRRPDTPATRLSGPRYRGATPQRTLWVSTAILNSTRSGTRSQCIGILTHHSLSHSFIHSLFIHSLITIDDVYYDCVAVSSGSSFIEQQGK